MFLFVHVCRIYNMICINTCIYMLTCIFMCTYHKHEQVGAGQVFFTGALPKRSAASCLGHPRHNLVLTLACV